MTSLVSFGFLAPPTIFIVLSLAGALIALVWRRIGIALVLASSLCLYAAATPALSSYLLRQVESGLPQTADLGAAQAIIVLGGGVRPGDGGGIPDRLDGLSLERVVFGAEAHRRLHLPVVVSGGAARGTHSSEGALMKAALEADFAVPGRLDRGPLAHDLGKRALSPRGCCCRKSSPRSLSSARPGTCRARCGRSSGSG